MKAPKPRTRPARSTKTPRGAKLPELSPIIHALWDAISMVACAHAAMLHADRWSPEEVVLRLGIDALKRVHDDLDGAETRLQGFRGARK